MTRAYTTHRDQCAAGSHWVGWASAVHILMPNGSTVSHYFMCDECESYYYPKVSEPTLALCPSCASSIGGAHGGPDAPWRAALPGEACVAADHDDIAGGA